MRQRLRIDSLSLSTARLRRQGEVDRPLVWRPAFSGVVETKRQIVHQHLNLGDGEVN